jgi:uncharacterized membrane protein YphA (DoxX/SURF4 family)
MKYLANIFRVFVGLLFIFSGLIKSNDPTGFSYKLDEYFSVFSAELEAEQDSIYATVTAPDGSFTKTLAINPNATSYDILAATSPWKAVSIGTETKDSVYFADASIYLNNVELLNVPVNAEDSNVVLLTAKIAYGAAGKQLGNKTITFKSFQSNLKNITIDAGEYVQPNSWLVDFFQGLRPYALALAIFLCVLEIVLGIALLIGWSPKLIVTLLIILILFFTFLTWYSAYYNKVTDCGCFGDAIKLTPWESFYKDIILCISIFFIALGVKYIKPIFSKPFAVKLLTVFTLFSTGFAMYCWHYLPVKNFLKFKKGNDIEALAVVPEDAPTDVYENVFIYAKDGTEEEFTLEQMSGRDLKADGYEFVDRKDKLISKGYEPEIHDFKIMDESRNNDYAEDFFANDSTHKILIVMNELEQVNLEAMEDLKTVIKACKKQGIEIYPLTASDAETTEAFRHEHQLDIPFYYGDKTNLKSIIRSNPGLVLFNGNVVKENWPSTRLPSEKRFLKKVAK